MGGSEVFSGLALALARRRALIAQEQLGGTRVRVIGPERVLQVIHCGCEGRTSFLMPAVRLICASAHEPSAAEIARERTGLHSLLQHGNGPFGVGRGIAGATEPQFEI